MKRLMVYVTLALVFLWRAMPSRAFTITPADITVSATVGNPNITPTPPWITPPPEEQGKFSIFGYASPGAKVYIDNPGMYVDTTADGDGYFEFASFFSRLMAEDICLVAQDQLGRISPPVCIPPVPSADTSSIGPVIMPPTLSLNSDSFYSGDKVNLSGQATPNTQVKLSLFTDESKTSLSSLLQDKDMPLTDKTLLALMILGGKLNPVKPAVASSLPKQDIKVDNKGNFTLTLPSSDPQYYRTFGQTIWQEAFSPRSVTLNFNIFPGWFIIMKFILGFFGSLKGRILEIILLLQIAGIAWYIVHRYTRPHQIACMRALALVEHPLPMVTEHDLLVQEHELLLEELKKHDQ